MKITFVANFLNNHTLPLCESFYKFLGEDFHFIATTRISEERKTLKNTELNDLYPFVIKTYERKEQLKIAQTIINESDVVILGSAPDKLLFHRLSEGKLTFRHCERLFKDGTSAKYFLKNFLRVYKHFGRFRKYNFYCLAASAFTAADINSFLNWEGRSFVWGYFPKTSLINEKDIESVIDSKKESSILWVGRLVDCKRPELIVMAAKQLMHDGIPFSLKIIGEGPKRGYLEAMINEYGLNGYVSLIGSMTPEEVQIEMQNSQIFCFTSNYEEGWGAVVNEAMNNGCAIVTSCAPGSVPFLITNDYNGLIYDDSSFDDMYCKITDLLNNRRKCSDFGKAAYYTIRDKWNADEAAKRFIELSSRMIHKDNVESLFSDGPCSVAQIMKDNWFISKEKERV